MWKGLEEGKGKKKWYYITINKKQTHSYIQFSQIEDLNNIKMYCFKLLQSFSGGN